MSLPRTTRRTIKWSLVACGVWAGIGLLPSEAASRGPTEAALQNPTPASVRPPEWFSIWQTEIEPPVPVPGNVRGLVKTLTPHKLVEIRWVFDGTGGERAQYDERFDLLYWPTAAARLWEGSPDVGSSMVVAGKRASDGRTVIEKWTPTFTGIPSADNPTQLLKSPIYSGLEPGKKVVRLLAPTYGVEGKVFVQFNDVRDLYVLDVATGEFTLALSVAQVPEIEFDSYHGFWGGKTTSGEHAYVFQCKFSQYDDGAVILTDDDADGVIDSWVSVDKDSWNLVETIDWEEIYPQ